MFVRYQQKALILDCQTESKGESVITISMRFIF